MTSLRVPVSGCLLISDRVNSPVEVWLRDYGMPLRITRSAGAAYCLAESQVDTIGVVIVAMRHNSEAIAALPIVQRARAIGHLPTLVLLATRDADVERQARNLGAFGCSTLPIDHTWLDQTLHAATTLRRMPSNRAKQPNADTLQSIGAMLADSSFSISTPAQASALSELLASACPEPGRRMCGINELLLNAIEHGNLGIDGDTKARLLHEGMWPQEIARRLDQPEHSGKRVRVRFSRDEQRVTLRIADQGAGFDWRAQLQTDLADVTGPSGRGIALARMLSFDELHYNQAGTEAIAVIHVAPPRPEVRDRVIDVAVAQRSQSQLPALLSPMEWVGLWMDIDYAINAASDDDFYITVLGLVLQRLRSSVGFFGYLNEAGDLVTPAVAHAGVAHAATGAAHHGVVFARDQWLGVWSEVMEKRETLIRNGGERIDRDQMSIHASVAVPITFRGELIGLIHVANRIGGYDARDKELMTLIAQRIAPALVAHIEHVRHQQKLIEAQQIAETAAEHARFFAMSQDFMLVLDDHVLRANPAFVEAFGWSEEELRTRSIGDLVHPDDRELARSEITERVRHPGQAHAPVVLRGLTKHAGYRATEWSAIGSHDGLLLAVGRDVTPLNQAVQRLATENTNMQRVHDMLQHEQVLAGEMLANIRSRGCLNEPCFRYLSSPLSFFNGDIVLADRTPDGEVRWVLGDFTGHGLSAAIGTTPVASAFYATTRKCVPMPEVVATLNDLLRSLLPSGLFCAVAMLSLDATRTHLRVWNGGLPAVLIRRAHDTLLRRVVSQGLPLGMVPSSELEVLIETLSVAPEDEVYVYSDGLSEAENEAGQMFGSPRIEASLLRAGDGDAFDRLLADVNEFRAGMRPADDVSLVQLKVGAVSAAVASTSSGSAGHRGVSDRAHFGPHGGTPPQGHAPLTDDQSES